MSLSDFEILSLLGKGSFGEVYKVRRKSDNEIYAMKKVTITSLTKKEIENALNEIRILASVCHPHIVSYKEAFYSNEEKCLCLVVEYVNAGDLEKKISTLSKSKTLIKESEIWSIFSQLVSALLALHNMHIIHRDLKSANVFIDKTNNIKLGDMNVSKVMANTKGMMKTQTGTPYYASPEIWKDLPYDIRSDTWSLGIILYEMCALRLPFRGKSYNEVYTKVVNGNYSPIPKVYSARLKEMIRWLLNVNPKERPTVKEVKKKLSEYGINDSDEKDKGGGERNELSMLKATLKIPKRMNDINNILPKARYKRNVQSANNNCKINKIQSTTTTAISSLMHKNNHLLPLVKNHHRIETSNDELTVKRKTKKNLNLPHIKNTDNMMRNASYCKLLQMSPTTTATNNVSVISNNSGIESVQFTQAEPIVNIALLRRKKIEKKYNNEIVLPKIPMRIMKKISVIPEMANINDVSVFN